jgi:hypothetical protein
MAREIRTTTIQNTHEIFWLARQRQIVEAEFAKRVYDVFNTGRAIQKLRDLAQALMRMMTEGPVNAFDAAIKDEAFLRLWQKVSRNLPGLTMWQSPVHSKRLDATDCADMIRLAGAWVECGGLGGGQRARLPRGNAPGTAKEAFRVGGRYVWGKDARVRNSGWDIETHLKAHMAVPNAPFTGMGGKSGFGGRKNSKRAAGTSSVLQLDRLFGLVVACDISGTTADSVFALEILGGEFGMSAGYYMLPLGTIAANMHHSVLEVALVLSLNGDMDYHVGFFNTLKPTRCAGFPPELGAIQAAIMSADAQMTAQGLHHVRYYEGHNLRGVFRFEGPEMLALRYSHLSDAVDMLDRAQCMGGYPQRHSVVQLLESERFRV